MLCRTGQSGSESAFHVQQLQIFKNMRYAYMIKTDYDVIVVGGGTAGVIAAIAAGRHGASTLLIEQYGHLGGTAVGGLPFLGMYDGNDKRVNAGIPQELVERMKAEGGCLDGCFGATWMDSGYRFSITPYEQETYKYVAQEMVLEAGADILFHSFVGDVTAENGEIKSIEVVNKSGKTRYTAKVYIDTTGDADVAWMAGVPMQEKEVTQNASILFKMGGVDTDKMLTALQEGRGIQGWGNWHTRILKGPRLDTPEEGLIHMAGHFVDENGKKTTFTAISCISTELYINATRTVNIDGADAQSVSLGEISERRNVHRMVEVLNRCVPGFEHAHLISTAPLGIRESRNIQGDYLLTREDVLSGNQFEDSVARGAYPIDIHDPKGGQTQFQFIEGRGSYSIPYRSLLPKGISNLLVAGRSLSATSNGMGSARIMGAVSSQGQAVGTAAAMAAKANVTPREINVAELQRLLTEDKALL